MDWKAELLKRLDAVADKLGTTSVYLWHVLVKQSVIQGITDIGMAIVLLAILIVGICLQRKFHAWHVKDGWDGEGTLFAYMVVYVLLIATTVSILINATNGLQELLNPEYYALHEVLETLGK